MYLAPDGHELEITSAAQAFLADAIPMTRLQAPAQADLADNDRKAIAGLGWFGIAVPEALGGSGLSEVEHALFFREVGRLCGPIEILALSLAANLARDDTLRNDLLSGNMACAIIVRDRATYRLLGSPTARYGILAEPGSSALIDLARVEAEPRAALDRTDTMRVCARLPEPVDRIESDRPWVLGRLGAAAMLVGIAEAALELIVDYARVRETFGRKIGSWQAVRHPCADMAVRLEASRSQLWFAAAACKEGRSDAPVHLTAAKHLANEAAFRNADVNIQLHGGIGVTEEHNAHLLLKRSLQLGRLFGSRQTLLESLLHASLVD